jgi:hypothetical protein
MKKNSLLVLLLVGFLFSHAQKITYSAVNKENFTDFNCQVIGKKNNKIFIYTAFFNTLIPASMPNGRLNAGVPLVKMETSEIEVFDTDMKLLFAKKLASPAENINNIHFVAFDTCFAMFYQYQKKHTIYYAVTKFDYDINMIGAPVQLDSTKGMLADVVNQIYTVCYSDNKKHFVVCSIRNDRDKTSVLQHLHFDQNFKMVKSNVDTIPIRFRKDFLHDFNVDDDGNFIFLRSTKTYDKNYVDRTSLFVQKVDTDTLSYFKIITPAIFIDELHLKIDNINKRYVLASMFSGQPGGDVEGIYTFIATPNKPDAAIGNKTEFSKEIRAAVQINGSLKSALNEYFIQNIHLKTDGGFLIDAGDFFQLFDKYAQNRWSYNHYASIQLVQNYSVANQSNNNYALDNLFDPNYSYPWHQWKYYETGLFSYNSNKILIVNFNADGTADWFKTIKALQNDRFVNNLGYITNRSTSDLYYVFNENIKNRVFITAQSIGTNGHINDPESLREDKMVRGGEIEYTCLPRLGKQVGEKELVMPCVVGRYICFAKVEL